MTLRPAELKAQQRISLAFIAADARDVILLRRTRTDDGAGGIVVGEPVPVPAQRLRLLPQEDGATERTTAEGESATPQYMLMGPADADMERYDEFELDGIRYEVVYIDDRKYELKGEVIRLGR
jgi:hypothetical protein